MSSIGTHVRWRAVTILDANNRVKTMTYDGVSNLLSTRYSDGTISSLLYDPLNRLTTATDWGGATSFSYSRRGETAGKTDQGLLSQAYRYDGNSNRIGLTDPDGGLYTYSFDLLDRQNGLVNRYNGVFTSAYDADSRPTTMQSCFDDFEISGYDPVGRLTTLIQLTSSLSPTSTMVFGFDPGGRKILNVVDGTAFTYPYDNNPDC